MTMRLDGVPVRREDVLLIDDGDRCVVAGSTSERTHELNPTARAIWELCDGTTRPVEMVDAICQVFSVTVEQAADDVRHALAQLTDAKLVTWADPSPRRDP